MAESIHTTATSKSGLYSELLPQLEALWTGETNPIANMANTAAALMQVFGHHWIGFYLVEKNELVLGPFQGPVACTRIGLGKGVCGTAWKEVKTQVVADVQEFPGHIACSSLSQSEIVVPMSYSGKVVGVLDIDSAHLNQFDETDAHWLEKIAVKLTQACIWD